MLNQDTIELISASIEWIQLGAILSEQEIMREVYEETAAAGIDDSFYWEQYALVWTVWQQRYIPVPRFNR